MSRSLFHHELLSLANNDIHIWQLDDERFRSQELLSHFDAVLSEEERSRKNRFKFEKDQHQYLVAHGALRFVLSNYYREIDPKDWKFEKNEYGRPDIVPPFDGINLYFNISHTKGKVLIAVGRYALMGVDVEKESRQTEPAAIAHRFFSKSEAERLLALPESLQPQRFFRLWTLKEAYIKACGMGLSIPLDHFSFHFDSTSQTVRIEFSSERKDEPSSWQFWHWNLGDDYRASLALKNLTADTTIVLKHLCVDGFGQVEEKQLDPILKSTA